MGLGGCSSTDDLAKADGTETNKKQSKRSKGECQKSTGSRLARNDC